MGKNHQVDRGNSRVANCENPELLLASLCRIYRSVPCFSGQSI